MMRIPAKTSLCSTLAIATALVVGARPAAAQVAGNLDNAGGATVTNGGANIVLNNSQTVIDWTATGTVNGGVNVFLPNGNTMDFSSGSNFAVLNRVNTGSDMLGLNGIVTSSVDGVAGRGTVFFYNPNGIVVGEGAFIDVGSLGLTTNPVTSTESGFIDNFGSADPKVTFGQGLASGQIRIDNGATLQANGSGGYVALVAPAIQHSGTIRTDGGVALVAAEAATITFSNSNLYTIQVDAGTTKNMVVDGGKIERTSEGLGDAHRAYLISVPQNDATTALIIANGAQLGFDIAGSAEVEDNAVILSAGADTSSNPPSAGQAEVTITGATISSDLSAFATDTLTIASVTGPIDIQRSADLVAGDAYIRAISNDISFGYSPFGEPAGTLSVTTDVIGGSGSSATAGGILLEAHSGSALKVAGDAILHANGTGGGSADGEDAHDGAGGSISLTSAGGSILVEGSLNAYANGYGGTQDYSDAQGGRGIGGSVSIATVDAGSISILGNADLQAKGEGGSNGECSSCNITGGNGYGGSVYITAEGTESRVSFDGIVNANTRAQGGAGDAAGGDAFGGGYEDMSTGVKGIHVGAGSGGALDFADSTYLDSSAAGGYAYDNGVGGDALGGHVNIGFFSGTGSTISFGNALGAYAGADGSSGATGGEGTGGRVQLAAENGDINVDGYYVDLGASGYGGYGWAGNGGFGRGGTVYLYSRNGSLTVDGSAYVSADGEGGGAGQAGAFGGDGQGGFASVFADTGGTTTLNGYTSVYADGTGGESYDTGVNAGNGTGGDARVQASGTNSLMQVNSTLTVSASGQGGYPGGECYYCGGVGGTGTGGHAWVDAFGSPTATLTLGDTLYINADGSGSFGLTGNGGDGLGGEALFQSTGGAQVHALGDVYISAAGYGGETDAGSPFRGGNATGGTARIQTHTTAGSSIEIDGFASVDASGYGGDAYSWYSEGLGGNGGDGTGGLAQLFASAGTITLHGSANVTADGNGADGYSGTGGNGTGGTAQADATGGTLLTQGLYVNANGSGGWGMNDGDTAGNGTGGTARLTVGAAGTVTVDGSLGVSAIGDGGETESDGSGGNGLGGNAEIALNAASAQLTVADWTTVDTTGNGGSGGGVGSTGGSGTGGWSRVYGSAGNATFGQADIGDEGADELRIVANGYGGSASGGTGGNGKGGQTRLNADGAAFIVDGNLLLSAESNGGDGAVGGNGMAFIGINPKNTATTDARVTANHGTIDVYGDTTLDVSARGGNGDTGNGGNAAAGYGTIFAFNSNLGPATITMGNVAVDANAFGGDGGYGSSDQGPSGNGGNGGNGGSALGGFIAITASSLNGHLDLGDLNLSVRSFGGNGGDGGDGSTDVDFPGTGGAGGMGGAAGNFSQTTAGGSIYIGTEQGANFASLGNTGTASFGNVIMDAASTGGDGGWGGWAATLGAPGNGGDAIGGNVLAQAVGGIVTAGNLEMTADAFGGSAGAYANESSGGIGGDAIGGGVGMVAYNRTGDESQRGALNVGDVTGVASAYGGYGAIFGGEWGQYAAVDMINGDVSANSVHFEVIASDGQHPTYSLFPSDWVVQNGTFDVATTLSVTAPEMSIWSQNGTISADAIALDIGNFVHDPFRATPVPHGVIVANTFSASTQGNLVIDADLDIAGPANFGVPGSIELLNVTSGVEIGLIANGAIITGDLDAFDNVWVQTVGDVWTGSILAGNQVAIEGQSINVGGPVDAGGNVFLTAAGSLTFGHITAGGLADLYGDGISGNAVTANGGRILAHSTSSLSLASAAASDNLDLDAAGALDVTGTLDAGGDALISADSILIGGTTSVGGSLQMSSVNDMGTGDIDAGEMDLYAGGDATLGALTTTYGGISGFAGNDLSLASAWSADYLQLIALNGDLTVAGNLDAWWNISLNAGGDIAFGAATTENDDIDAFAGGNLTATGDIQSGADVDLEANGLVQTADILAQGSVTVQAGAIDVGDVWAGIDLGLCGGICSMEFVPEDIGLWSATTLTAGNLDSTGRIGLAAGGDMSVGTIEAYDLVMVLAGGDFASGHVLTDGAFYMGGFDMFALGYDVELDQFDPAPILALSPTPTGGNATIGGALSALSVVANAGGDFASGDLTTADGDATIEAGGDITTAALSIAGNLALTSGGSTSVGSGTIAGVGTITALGGTIDAGALTAFGALTLSALDTVTTGALQSTSSDVWVGSDSGAIAIGGASAGQSIYLNAANGVASSGDLNAGSDIFVNAGGNVDLQDALASSELGIVSGGDVTVGDATSYYTAWLVADGSITADSLSAGYVALALADGAVAIGTLSAGSEGPGYAGIGGRGIYDLANLDGFDAYYAYTLIQGEPGAGNIDVGAIYAGGISLHGDNVTVGTVDYAYDTTVTANGTASVTGLWNSTYVDITSDDIQIGANGGIDADSVNLYSTNGIGAGIGDNSGVANGAYLLDASEVGRIDASNLLVYATDTESAIDLMIGDVTLDGGEKYYDFGVVNPATGQYSGRLRVTGKIEGSGWTDDDYLDLDANIVEVEAVNGGIDFSPDSDAAVGTLGIYAPHFHVAEAAILDKLAVDFDYAGRDAELAVAPTAPHDGTTINVGLVELYLDYGSGQGGFAVAPLAASPDTIYAQNMSSTNVRSGLLIRDAEIFGQYAPGSIDMVINGQWQTDGGTLTGVDVRDAFLADPDNEIALFTATSSINGCGLDGGPCGEVIPPEPPVPPVPPFQDIANQIVLLDTSIGDLLDFGDVVIDDPANPEDEDIEEPEGNAIDPPQSLIDDKPLDPNGATDEPVSGGGNPALIGTGSSKKEDK